MKEPFTIKGRWHVHGEDHPAHYGRLFCDPVKGLRLEVKEPKAMGIEELFSSLTNQSWDDARRIQGFDSDNRPIRLFGCCESGWTEKLGLKTHDFFVHRAVTNLREGSWPELRSRTFRMTFTILNQWINPSGRISAHSEPKKDIEFKIGFINATLGTTRRHEHSKGLRMTEDKWIKLVFPDACQVSTVLNEHVWLMALLLSLLVGDLVGLDEFTFLPEGETKGSANERLLLQKARS